MAQEKTFIPKGFVEIKQKYSKKRHGYMLVNKSGNPIVTCSKLPIYWYKKVALAEARKWDAEVIKVTIN